MIDIRMRPYQASTPEGLQDDPIERPGSGWKPDMTLEQVWEWNRGYYRFGPRARHEHYATFSFGDDRVKAAARITGVTSAGVVPSKGVERFQLEGYVIKPGDADYDRLMSKIIPWHRGFRYIDSQ